MNSYADQLRRAIKRYRTMLLATTLPSMVLLLLSIPRLHSMHQMLQFALFSGSLIPWLILANWEIRASTSLIKHLARRLRLDKEQTINFTQTMSLLDRDDPSATDFTVQLQNRALEPWTQSVLRACRAGKWIVLLLTWQLVFLAAFWLTSMHTTQATQQTIHLTTQPQAISSTDVQQTTSTVDQLAYDLLALRNLLTQADDMMTDVQWDDLMQQINALWQSIKTQWQAIASQSDAQMLSLQSDANLPVTAKASLQSSSWRQTALASLTADIKALARRGANFDGPGVLSTGQSTAQADDAATTAHGLYHEYPLPQDATSNDAQRRLQTVPPAYRQAVGAYLMGSQDPNDKGP